MKVRSTDVYDAITITPESREELGIDPLVPDGFIAVFSGSPVKLVALLAEEDFLTQYEEDV